MNGWRIQLLGELRAVRGAQVVTRFRTRKTGELLAYLCYYRQRTHPRELLIDLFWPECELQTGRQNLSVALSALRGQLDAPDSEPPASGGEPAACADAGSVILADRFSVGVDPARITTDVAEFEVAFQSAGAARDTGERARRLADAAELYGGALLPGYYADWLFPEQQRLEELYFQTLRQLIAHHERAGELDAALRYALRATSADTLREEAHQEVMRLYASTGQSSAALRHYHELERLLREQIDATPSDATRALADEITSGAAGARRWAYSVRETTATPPADSSPKAQGSTPNAQRLPLEPVGGAVPLGSKFYVLRAADEEFQEAIAQRDSIVLVKGPRQVGKTSLLARGLERARQLGAHAPFTDFQMLNARHLESADALLLALAEDLAEQLDLDVAPADHWDDRRGANPNFRRFMRHEVLGKLPAPVVWGMDEVDRLFTCDFRSEVFGLFRAWHNERALGPAGPWARLTLAMSYATEDYLFIADASQSPFNVGTRLELEDFTLEQVADLNGRYRAPLKRETEVGRFYRLVGGQPYLVRRGLHAMAGQGMSLAALEGLGSSGAGIFGEHLRRLHALLARDPELCAVMRGVLQGRPCPTPEAFHRLRSAGLIAGESATEARPRCQLYADYLAGRLDA